MSKAFRFNVLSNDVDMDNWTIHKPVKEKKVEPEPVKKVVAKPKEKTVKKKQEKESLKALAFGNPTTKTKKKAAAAAVTNEAAASSAKSNGKGTASSKKTKSNGVDCNGVVHDKKKTLSDDWKNRDQQFIEEENERELREALLLSKLDYEANKDTYQQSKEDSNKNTSKTKKKKKEKPITISLSEFNTMDTRKLSSMNGNDSVKQSKSSGDNAREDSFFDDVEVTVRNTIVKESRQKQYNEQLEKRLSKNESNSNTAASRSSENATQLVPISEVEKRDFEIQALNLEVASLKDQLEKVKLRNKKLYEVLGTAEMRSIGEVVIDLRKVSKARDELSAEVATLSGQLEQEKTKVSQLQDKHRKK